MAHAMGADFLEQDVVLSKDGIPVVLHDVQLDTVTDVAVRFPDRHREDSRYYALDFTVAELKHLRVCERFNSFTGRQVYPNRFPKGAGNFQIPTLEEELQLIQGLNRSTGRKVGIYPEIKQPAWHREQGHDISGIVLPILRRYGYSTKEDACWLQCFDWAEVQRIRRELSWNGRLLQLFGGRFEDEILRSPEGLAEVAKVADGIGPSISTVISGASVEDRTVTDLVRNAHAQKLVVHAYTMRVDELPKTVRDQGDLLAVLFREAGADGLFTDFPDVVIRWLAERKTPAA